RGPRAGDAAAAGRRVRRDCDVLQGQGALVENAAAAVRRGPMIDGQVVEGQVASGPDLEHTAVVFTGNVPDGEEITIQRWVADDRQLARDRRELGAVELDRGEGYSS